MTTIKNELTAPLVHLNGTGRTGLLDQYKTAVMAVRAASDALRKAAPHGRDYYLLGDDALTKAVHEHRQRTGALENIETDLNALAKAVYRQGR